MDSQASPRTRRTWSAAGLIVHFIVLTSWSFASAQVPCDDYRDHFRWVGGLRAYGAGTVDIAGDLGCLCLPQVGMHTFDASDPTAPVLLGFVPISGWLWEVVIDGDLAFVARGSWGLSIVDLSNPEHPIVVGSINPPGIASDVFVDFPMVYIASGRDEGAYIVDASDPTNPVLVGNIPSPGDTFEIVVDDGIAYLAGGNAGLRIHDVSDPNAPFALGYWVPWQRVYGLDFADGLVYAANAGSGLQILDVSNTADPVVIGVVDTPDEARAVTLVGNRALVADKSGMVQVDISVPTSPVLVSRHGTIGEVYSVSASDRFAFFADYPHQLNVVDFSVPTPLEPSAITSGGALSDVLVENQIGYGARPYGALQIFDLSDPLSPVLLGTHSGSGGRDYLDLDQREGTVAAAAESDGIDLFDATVPSAPVLAANVDLGAYTMGVAFREDLLLATAYGGAHLFDVQDPYAPTPLGSVKLGGYAQGPAWNGSVAYVGLDSMVVVLDVSAPESPLLIAEIEMPTWVLSITVDEGQAIVALGDHGLAFLDVSDPLAPVISRFVRTPGSAVRVLRSGEFIHVACTTGFASYWAPPGETPVAIGSATTPGGTKGLATADGFVLVGNSSDDGLLTYAGPCPIVPASVLAVDSEPSLIRVTPNPFSTRARITCVVPVEQSAGLAVFDAQGRRVRDLLHGALDSGTYVQWDGLDDRGHALPNGPYWVRLQTEAAVETGSVRLIR